jgi:hypothetical protein
VLVEQGGVGHDERFKGHLISLLMMLWLPWIMLETR